MHNTAVAALLLSLFLARAGRVTVAPAAPPLRPANAPAAIGLAVNLPESASPAERQSALDSVRRSGASFFALELSWPAAEPRPRRYDVLAMTRTARLLRQSGVMLHLDLPLVNGRARELPADLAAVSFDPSGLGNVVGEYGVGGDRRYVHALGLIGMFGTVGPCGYEFDGLGNVVGMTAPDGSVHNRYVYAPFLPSAPFAHRPPETIDRDWKAILAGAAGRPVGFTEVSYSSAPENGSTPEKQAEFVRRMRRLAATTDRSRLMFARYVAWRDPDPRDSPDPAGLPPLPLGRRMGEDAVRRAAFFAHRGLVQADGKPKPAWREWTKATSPIP